MLADVRYEWSIIVFEVYSFWDLYKSPELMVHCQELIRERQQLKRRRNQGKDFLIKKHSSTS